MNVAVPVDAFMEPDFPEHEYTARYARARSMMREQNIDALLITNVDNYTYFSGHTATYGAPHWMWSSHARPFAMILPVAGAPVLITHFLEKPPAQRSSPWCEVRTYVDMPFKYSLLVDALREFGLEKGRIGAEMGLEQRFNLPVDDLRSVERALPQAEFVDASAIFLNCRYIKSPLEVERLRRACEIAEEAFRTVIAEVSIGVTERELVKRLTIRMLELGADRPAHFLLSRVAPYHMLNRPSDRRLEAGQTVRVDFGAIYREYKCDMSWTAVFGPPSQKQTQLFDLVAEIISDLEGMIRPGIEMRAITHRCNELLAKNGFPPKEAGRIGHGIGLNGNERPSIDLTDATIVQPGMCLALEPGIYDPAGGFVIEDNFVVRSDGIELLHPDTLKRLYVVSR